MTDSFDPRPYMYIVEPKREGYLIFKMSGLELYFSFLKRPIALFSLILTCDNCCMLKCAFKWSIVSLHLRALLDT